MEKQISIKVVLDRLLRHPLIQNLNFETAIDYVIDFIRIVDIPQVYIEKVDTIQIENYRAVLPCDLVEVLQVKEHCHHYCMRATTDTFHEIDKVPNPFEYTFKIQGDIIYTNFREGTLDIAYRAILTDDDGYPMIPEDPTFIRALETYIKKQWFTILFDMGRIQQQVLVNVQQEYAFYVGQAQAKMAMPTLSEMESLTNMWTSLLHKTNEFKTGFKNTGMKELIKIQQ